MATQIWIDGTLVDWTLQFEPNRLDLALDEASMFYFALYGQGMQLRAGWVHGATIEVQVDGSAVKNFRGKIRSVSQQLDPFAGWVHAYTVQGMRGELNRIPITSSSFNGTVTYNRQVGDPLYDASNASLPIGTMIQRLLDLHRPTLNAAGLGSGGSAVYLASDFTADWCTVVPTEPVNFSGPRFMNAIDNELSKWAGNVACWPEFVAHPGQ
jgi:hypothetical protein